MTIKIWLSGFNMIKTSIQVNKTSIKNSSKILKKTFKKLEN